MCLMGLSHAVQWLKTFLQSCLTDRLTQLLSKVEWPYITNVSYCAKYKRLICLRLGGVGYLFGSLSLGVVTHDLDLFYDWSRRFTTQCAQSGLFSVLYPLALFACLSSSTLQSLQCIDINAKFHIIVE